MIFLKWVLALGGTQIEPKEGRHLSSQLYQPLTVTDQEYRDVSVEEPTHPICDIYYTALQLLSEYTE